MAAARENFTRLRAFYQYKISHFRSDQYVFVDESGTDQRIGFRRTTWSPLGIAPVQGQALAREDRYQIIPAYTSEGILTASIYRGATNTSIFEDFVKNILLPKCGKYPAKNSVIIMDNASIHHSETIRQLCADAGVILVYLPPYSPSYNPVEGFISELKAFVQENWRLFFDTTDRSHEAFRRFLSFCALEVGRRRRSARGYFWDADLLCEESEDYD